jgi:hypothetical protein
MLKEREMTQDPTNHGESIAGQVRHGIEQARTELGGLDDIARALIRERPVVAVLAAIGFGYFAARLFSRL